MLTSLRRGFNIYGTIAAMMPKLYLAYSIWVWMQLFVQIIAVFIQVAFWRAVFASSPSGTVGSLGLNQTLNYIILAQIFLPALHASSTIYYFGSLMRQGQVGIELLRPVDFQLSVYVRNVSEVAVGLVTQLPLAVVAWFIFPYQLPADPLLWLAFFVTLFLGNAVLFFFDWILACVSFYSTETWGLSVLRFGISNFLAGSLIPLAIMPLWLQQVAGALPFSYALYVPVSLISGITPLETVLRIWLLELAYLAVLIPLSRYIFKVAVRKVTVQGG